MIGAGFRAALLGSVASSIVAASVPAPVAGEDLLKGYFTSLTNIAAGSGAPGAADCRFNLTGPVRVDAAKPLFGLPTFFQQSNLSGAIDSANSDVFNLSSSQADFTLETWVAPTAAGAVLSRGNYDNSIYRGFYLNVVSATTVTFFFRTASATTGRSASCTISGLNLFDGNFHHIAVQRRSNVIEVFINGVRGATTYNIGTDTLQHPDYYFGTVGGRNGTTYRAASSMQGWIGGLRLTTGVVRYAGASFTPPTTAFPQGAADANWTQTRLLVDGSALSAVTLGGTGAASTTLSVDAGANAGSPGGVTVEGAYTNVSGHSVSLTVAGTAADVGDANFTFEVYLKRKNPASTGALLFGGTLNPITIRFASGGFLEVTLTNAAGTALTITTTHILGTVDTHVAVTRSGGTVRVYAGGALVGTSTTLSGALRSLAGATVTITSDANNGVALRSFRLTKGQVRYTSAGFTPPAVSALIA